MRNIKGLTNRKVTHILKTETVFSVGEATTGIRIAAAKWWRHHELANSLCRQ